MIRADKSSVPPGGEADTCAATRVPLARAAIKLGVKLLLLAALWCFAVGFAEGLHFWFGLNADYLSGWFMCATFTLVFPGFVGLRSAA